MPLSLATLFRMAIVVLLAVHVFAMFVVARRELAPRELDLGVVVMSAAFSAVMLLPFVWAVALPDLPELYARVRAERRWRDGRCPACGYDLSGTLDGTVEHVTCPECGRRMAPPPPHRFGGRSLIRFAALLVAAWLLGVSSAVLWAACSVGNG